MGYGLPCAKCKAYYQADLKACPICKTTQRVSPKATVVVNVTAEPPVAETPELEEERERFLREFRAQMLTANAESDSMGSFKCTLNENHDGEYEAAAVCQGCYEKVQERVDVMEAALHMDVKEAAQIVYDAVWADTIGHDQDLPECSACVADGSPKARRCWADARALAAIDSLESQAVAPE